MAKIGDTVHHNDIPFIDGIVRDVITYPSGRVEVVVESGGLLYRDDDDTWEVRDPAKKGIPVVEVMEYRVAEFTDVEE